MKKLISLLILYFLFPSFLASQEKNAVRIGKTKSEDVSGLFHMGTSVNPNGNSITMNSLSMLYNNMPILPVMGEFHYARYPESDWRQELLKMKAGGINIVASYIFWIHHEEIEGEFDWSGQRNLKRFVELCKEVGLPVILRLGPWCHGEARNGGIPEWMLNQDFKLRQDNPQYLEKVNRWFNAIYSQVKDQMWKDGGVVIGIQIENEYRGRWEHLMTLKNMAKEIGFNVPLYTRTGWPKLASQAQFGEIIPLYGDYADGFWDRSLDEMPGDYDNGFLFRPFRNSTVIATEQLPKQSGKDEAVDLQYPYFTCELGGGMMTSYHRRINIDPMDVYSMALVKVGSGSNMPGYYMYHGGTNPSGKLTTLNERQNSNLTNHNDLPVKSYDFQAPIREFGQISEHYHLLRRLHIFLKDFGPGLTTMLPYFPDIMPVDANDDSVLRWSARSNGNSGYVFVNNYHRLKKLSEKKNVQFTLDLDGKEFVFPHLPIDIPAGESFFMPFNMELEGIKLLYSTAQPIAKIKNANTSTFFFTQNHIPAEFVFESNDLIIKSVNGEVQKGKDYISIKELKPGLDIAISFSDNQGDEINIVLLNNAQSLSLWKIGLGEEERIIITDSELTYNKGELFLNKINSPNHSINIFPAPKVVRKGDDYLQSRKNGIFAQYELEIASKPLPEIKIKKIQEEKDLRNIEMGRAKVAEMPNDSDFESAAIWHIALPENTTPERDLYLRFPYLGDVARIYLNDNLLTDNFYNGKPFELGVRRFAPDIYKNKLEIKILPLQKNAPVYLQKNVLPDFRNQNSLLEFNPVEIFEKHSVLLYLQ